MRPENQEPASIATQSPFGLSSVSGGNTTRDGKTGPSLVCLEIQPRHALYRFFASQSLRRHCHLRQKGFCRWAPCHLSTGALAVIRHRRPSLASVAIWDRYDLLSRNWPHNTLNSNELYKFRLWPLYAMNADASSLHKSRIRRYLSTLESRSDGRLLNYRCPR
jgi:hypothetical protein